MRSAARVWMALTILAAATLSPAAAHAAPIQVVGASITPSGIVDPSQAGAHPDLTVVADFCGATVPCADQQQLKNLLITLPPGLIANPQATTSKCTHPTDLSQCTAQQQVGEISIGLESGGSVIAPFTGEVYNLEPNSGELARFGIRVPSFPPALRSQSVGFGLAADGTIAQEHVDLPNQPGVKVRSVTYKLYGTVDSKPFVFNPTSCGTQQGHVEANSYDDATLTKALASYTTTGCSEPPLPAFDPQVTLTPDSTVAGQPSGYTFTLDTGFDASAAVAKPYIRNTTVVMPPGLTLSASAGTQLDSCSSVQLAANACPADSVIGDITVQSPFVDHDVTGHAYFGVPTDTEPYPVLFGFDSSGVGVQLQSQSQVDEQTGQITALTIDQPQLPFTSFELHLRGGDRAVLANPTACGAYHASASFTPWSGLADAQTGSTPFTVDQGYGKDCPQARGFTPTVAASLSDTTARAHTHLRTLIERSDNDQQLKSLEIQTPPGLTATLAELPHCPRAAAFAGSCDATTRIGDITVVVGAGNSPITQHGQMYLTDPLNDGDVIGFSFVIPAKAGPIDFGNVVTTSGVRLDSGGDTATTDATEIPRIFKGIPVPIRKIDVDLNSDHFLINPSNCDPKHFQSVLHSDEGAQQPASVPLQTTGCEKLGFAPKLVFTTNAKGQPKYNNQRWHPPVRVLVTQQDGEAAIRSTRTAIPDILRPNLAGVQKNLCQGATLRNCPVSSRVGEATVETPLLSKPLSGYMYLLQEPGKILPKIALALDGPVSVDVDSRNAIEGIRTVNYFDKIPDVPVRKVDFFFYGGNGTNGILNAFSDLCTEKSYGDVSFTAHNGKKSDYRPVLNVDGCPAVAKLSIKQRKLRVRHGVAKLKLRCGAPQRCVGKATLVAGKQKLGSGKVNVKPRKVRTVKLKLTTKAVKQLRKRKRLKAAVSVALERQPVQSAGRVVLSGR